MLCHPLDENKRKEKKEKKEKTDFKEKSLAGPKLAQFVFVFRNKLDLETGGYVQRGLMAEQRPEG